MIFVEVTLSASQNVFQEKCATKMSERINLHEILLFFVFA